MKTTATILAALVMSLANSNAGETTVTTGKSTPPPPPMDPCAGPISYSNIELLYANTDWDGSGDSADGVVLRGEYSPMANLYLTAGVGFSTDDYADDLFLTAGIGGYLPLTDNIHVAADAGVLYNDVDYDSGGSDSDTGWYARPHLRAKFGCLTVHAGAIYTDIWDEDDWSWFVSAYYQIAAQWDLTVGYLDGDNSETITAGARWRF